MARAIGDMASAAGLFGIKLLARHHRIGVPTGGAGEPRGVVRRLQDRDPAAHQSMIRAAILRTKEVVTSGLGGAEPHGVVMARDDVHFHAERGNEEVMNNVLAGHDQAYVPAHRNVQFIYFFQAIGLLRFPHPLFADDVNVEGILRRASVIHVDDGAPTEHGHRQN